MKFLVDAQLPPALALQAAPDVAIWSEAQQRGATIITRDEDFIAGSRGRFSRPIVPVAWIRIGNTSRRALLAAVLPLIPEIVRMIEAGEAIVEVRGD